MTRPAISHRDCYSHQACGFHWHNVLDGMGLPMTSGVPFAEPVCPRCEIKRLREAIEALCAESEYVVLAADDPGTAPVLAVAAADLRAALITPEAPAEDDYEYRCTGCGATADAACFPGCPEDPCEECGGIDKHLNGCAYLGGAS